jgi:hypothetical protein
MRPVRLLTLLLALSAALLATACGQEAQDRGGFQTENAQAAETEAIYIDLDGLKYQVQVSRQLNALSLDDKQYLEGVSGEESSLSAQQEWFAIFMRVENDSEVPHEAAREFEIHDTQENVYTPIRLPESNPFAYKPRIVQPGNRIPVPDSAAGERSPYGEMILFKVQRFSLDNRPLELFVEGPNGGTGIINLDV